MKEALPLFDKPLWQCHKGTSINSGQDAGSVPSNILGRKPQRQKVIDIQLVTGWRGFAYGDTKVYLLKSRKVQKASLYGPQDDKLLRVQIPRSMHHICNTL